MDENECFEIYLTDLKDSVAAEYLRFIGADGDDCFDVETNPICVIPPPEKFDDIEDKEEDNDA